MKHFFKIWYHGICISEVFILSSLVTRQEFVLSGVCLSEVWIRGECISGVCLSEVWIRGVCISGVCLSEIWIRGVCISGVCHGTVYRNNSRGGEFFFDP